MSSRRPAAHRRAAAALAVASVLVGALLSGCAAEPAPPASPTVTPRTGLDRPVAGDCWAVPEPEETRAWSWWQGDAPVDCDTGHAAITVAVTDLDETVERPAPADGRDELPEATNDLLAATCDAALGRTSPADALGTRVESLWYLPSWEQWQGGERWVRCDVGVTAFGPVNGTGLEALPATAAEVVGAARDAYRICTDGPLPAEGEDFRDVYVKSALVPCDADADWEFAFAFDLWQDEFPGQDRARQVAADYCEAHLMRSRGARDGYVAYFPSAETWAEGRRTVQCWLESSAAQLDEVR